MKFKKNVFGVFVLRFLGMFLGFVLNIYIAQVTGTTGYGQYSFAIAIISILTIVNCWGLDQYSARWIGTIKGGKKFKVQLSCFYIESFISVLIVSLISCILIAAFCYLSDLSIYPEFLFSFVSSPLLALILLNESVLRSIDQPIIAAYPSLVIRPVVFGVLIMCCLLQFQSVDINTILVFMWVSILVTFFYITVITVKRSSINIKEVNVLYVKNYFNLIINSKEFLVVALLGVALNKADIMLLGLFLNKDQVGLYAGAYNISFLSVTSLQVIGFVAGAELSKLYASKNKYGLQNLLSRSRYIAILTSIPLVIPCLLFPEQVMSIYGEGFKGASNVLEILSVGMFMNASFGIVGYFLIMTGNAKVFSKIILFAISCKVPLLTFTIPKYGIIGAAVVVTVIMGIWNLVAFFYTHKILNNITSLSHGKTA